MGPSPSPTTRQLLPPRPAMGKVTGGGSLSPLQPGGPRAVGPSGTSSYHRQLTHLSRHLHHRSHSGPPPFPRPPRPFVLIPDSAAPAAAAKRTLHFRFRTEPPLSQNLRPFLPVAPPLPPPLPRRRVLPARGVLGTRGGRGLAALQPRQAQSPPDKPLNRGLPRGVTPAFGAKTSV